MAVGLQVLEGRLRPTHGSAMRVLGLRRLTPVNSKWFEMGMDQYLLIAFLGGWTSINPSYFDVNHRGTRFWPTAKWCSCYGLGETYLVHHDGIVCFFSPARLQVLHMSASTRSNASAITRRDRQMWSLGPVAQTQNKLLGRQQDDGRQDATALQYFMWRFSDHSCWAWFLMSFSMKVWRFWAVSKLPAGWWLYRVILPNILAIIIHQVWIHNKDLWFGIFQ